jgi:hypothetical protein
VTHGIQPESIFDEINLILGVKTPKSQLTGKGVTKIGFHGPRFEHSTTETCENEELQYLNFVQK